MSSVDLPSRFASLPLWRKSVSVIVIVGIVAFAIWTLPNWWEFWRNVGQFPSLWQIPTNRKIIIYLLIKIVSPLLISSNLSIASSFQIADISQPVALGSGQSTVPEPLISLRLLKDISMTINVPGKRHVVVPLTLNAKRVQLLAYIAWRRGELIDRDKILEHVFGWGLSDEEATEDKLSERFESHKKLLRKKVREIVIEQINTPAGRQVIDPDLDPFNSDSGFWGLSDICRVDDIEAVETNYKVISFARKEGKLVEEIPEYIKEACDLLEAFFFIHSSCSVNIIMICHSFWS